MEKLMIEYFSGHYVPKALCVFDENGSIADVKRCYSRCRKNCEKCEIQKIFNTLAVYEMAQERLERIREIINESDYYTGECLLTVMDLMQIKEDNNA